MAENNEVRTLIFDTETNGKRPKKATLVQEPAITQIAGILYLGRRPVAHLSCFVEPLDGQGNPATIPDEQFFRDAGITHETIDAVGLPLKTGLAMFNQFVKIADRIVAHNIMFDDPVTRGNFMRIAAPQRDYWDLPKFCTMKTLEPILKLPGKYGYKFPSLDESYRALVDPMGFEGAHDAMKDVEACADVLWAIEDKGHDLWQLPENWPEA
jgi:DNA polymerase III epsilon subunit-like protein